MLSLLMLCASTAPAQNKETKKPAPAKTVEKPTKKAGGGLTENIKKNKKLKLTVDRVVEYLLRNNLDVKSALLEYKGSDSPLKEFQAKYDWYLFGSGGYGFERTADQTSTTFGGKTNSSTNYAAGIKKMFRYGTSVTVSGTGVITNKKGMGVADFTGDGVSDIPGGRNYQHGLQIDLEQELLKNVFGMNDRLKERKLRTVKKMTRQGVKLKLAGLLVEALIGYWNVAVAEKNLAVTRESLRSTMDIRNLIARKLRLGLAERENIMDWSSRVLTARSQVMRAEKMLYDAKLAVLRTLNLDSNLDIELGQTFKVTPPQISLEQAMGDAFIKRVDWTNQEAAIKNAGIDYEIARREKWPSLKLKMGIGSQDYDAAYFGSYNTFNEKYSVSLEATYPLGNTAADVKLRNSRLALQQENVKKQSLEMVIRDEVKSLVKQCQVDYDVYRQTKRAREYAQNFYYQVLTKFRRGRYNAEVLKNALDAYMGSQQAELKSLVDYNVSLIRRDLARNVIFENFTIEIDRILRSVAE